MFLSISKMKLPSGAALALCWIVSASMDRKRFLLALLGLLAVSSASATFSWVSSLDGPAGVQCSITCGSKISLQGLTSGPSALNFAPQACAVNNAEGVTQIGTLWFNKNTLSCYVYSNSSEGQPVSVPSSAWFCPCLDRATVVANINGTTTESCASSCSRLSPVNGTYYNTSITSCTQPIAQSVCYDSVQNSFGYQPARDSNLPCLTVNPPAQSTADTLPAQRATAFQCLCSDANSTANLQVSSSCRTVPSQASAPAPVVPLPAGVTKSSSLSTGAIAGIAVGVAVAAVLLIGGIIYFLRRRRTPSAKSPQSVSWDVGAKKNPFDTEGKYGTLSSDLISFGALNKGDVETTTGSNSSSSMLHTTGAVTPGRSIQSLANIIELQEKKEITAVELPMPQKQINGAVDNFICKIRTGSSELEDTTERSVSQNDALEEVGLLSTWKIEPADLNIRMKSGKPMLLGEGGYGKVYRGVLNKAEVAIKVVSSHDRDQQAKFVQEIVTLRACHNTHIVQFLGACIQDRQTFMAMEFMDNGDLFTQLDCDASGRLGWYKLGQKIALDVCLGLCYLHSKHIAHLDLKSPNVLLNSNFQAKIGDVGLGKIISARQAAATRQGSLFWAAPEQLLGTECSTACDMFSFGTVVWEICSGERPVNRQTRQLETPEEAPHVIQDLIDRCHAKEPSARPTAEQAFDMLRLAARTSKSGSAGT